MRAVPFCLVVFVVRFLEVQVCDPLYGFPVSTLNIQQATMFRVQEEPTANLVPGDPDILIGEPYPRRKTYISSLPLPSSPPRKVFENRFDYHVVDVETNRHMESVAPRRFPAGDSEKYTLCNTAKRFRKSPRRQA